MSSQKGAVARAWRRGLDAASIAAAEEVACVARRRRGGRRRRGLVDELELEREEVDGERTRRVVCRCSAPQS